MLAMATCAKHPDRKTRCRDMCGSCYVTWWREERGGSAYKARQREANRVAQARRLSTPDGKAKARDAWLRAKYGISTEQRAAMLVACGGCCEICSRPFDGPPNVDHDHSTGDVRGLLCSPCNQGLGHFADDEARLERAAAYLSSRRRKAVA